MINYQYLFQLLIIGMGGFVGATLRFIISSHVQQLNKGLFFPWGTLTVNLLGCLIIGFLIQLNESWHPFSNEVKSFILVGLLGSLTTYSTFSNDAFNLLIEHRYMTSMIYMSTQLIFGLFAVFIGRLIVQLILFKIF
jgi:CrcB protein